MNDDEYDQWRAAEADYKAQRRKRSNKSATRKEAGYLWNQTDPIIKFENLIPHWQSIVVAFLRAVREGAEPEAAWAKSRGYVQRDFADLDESFRRALGHIWEMA